MLPRGGPFGASRAFLEHMEGVEMLVRVPPLLGGLLWCSCCAPRALLGSLVRKEGQSCPQKDFWEHDVVRSLGRPWQGLGGVPSGPVGPSWGLMEGLAGHRESRLGPSAHPATVPGLWLRGLLSVRWDLVVSLSGASSKQI